MLAVVLFIRKEINFPSSNRSHRAGSTTAYVSNDTQLYIALYPFVLYLVHSIGTAAARVFLLSRKLAGQELSVYAAKYTYAVESRILLVQRQQPWSENLEID